MNKELIAPCGMNCGICASYLAMKNDLVKKGVRKKYCSGCLPGDMNCHYKMQCDRLVKGIVQFCYEYVDFPCRLLKTIDKRYRTFYHMSMIENLRYIKEYGLEQFLKQEQEKWKCHHCGETICCHNGICFNCGLELLRNKKRRYRWDGD